MSWLTGRRAAPETRAESLESQNVPVSHENFLSFFGVSTVSLPTVTVDNALQVPAVLCAVAFLSRTLASLPLHAYRTTSAGPQRLNNKLDSIVNFAPNSGQDSFKFRNYFWQQVFTGGRGLAWIERTPRGVEAIWPMDPAKSTVVRNGPKVSYRFEGKEYPAEDVIDVPFMLKSDGVSHYGPIMLAGKAIQLALAMNDYGSNFFAGGGVPPLALTGPLPQGKDAFDRAMGDVHRSIENAKKSDKPIFAIPPGHTLGPVGLDPAKGQMVEARGFQIAEIARAYQIPPVFLQDLTHGTYSNTEQQGAILVKHLIVHWAEALEGEMTLKCSGRASNGVYIEHNIDGLMRGEFLARMDGLGKAVNSAILTPNEARALENRPAMPHGDKLMIQGATVPLGSPPAAPANDNEPPEQETRPGDKPEDVEDDAA